jgi:broad specificity phosphatase PhoE
MRLLLLRHGQTSSNVIGALDTAVPGASLTSLGRAQADAVPAGLSEERVDAVYVSTLTRTQQTAAPLAESRGLPATVLDGIEEIGAGSLEMLSDRRSQGQYVATIFSWAKGDLTTRMPGGESGIDFFRRYDAAIEGIVAKGGAGVVVVSHGAAIRTWVAARCENTDGAFAGTHQLDNTGLAILESQRGRGWRMIEWHPAPIGGLGLADSRAVDPTGERVE